MQFTSYTVLHLIEFDEYNQKDSEFIILFDESEQNYYCYGTRKKIRNSYQKLDYEYNYDYSRLNSLISFIRIATNNFNNTKYTIELNNINIYDYELDSINFDYLLKKFNTHNEIVAYENQKLNKKKLKKILKTLTSSY
jgi:hypothetical protein